MTPLTPIGGLVSTPKADAPKLQTLATLERIPTVSPMPKAIPTVSKVPEGINPAVESNTAPQGPQFTSGATSGPPPLTKVTKAVSEASRPVSKASSPHVADLRPSWLIDVDNKANSEEPRTVATPIAKSVAPLAPVLERVVNASEEDRNSLYVITCCIGKPLPGEEDALGDVNIIHGIYTYAEAMKLRGGTIMEKLSTLVTSNISDLAPPFIKMGIGLGTIEVNVMYPAASSRSLVARVQVQNSQERGHGIYRTYVISRMKPNKLVEQFI